MLDTSMDTRIIMAAEILTEHIQSYSQIETDAKHTIPCVFAFTYRTRDVSAVQYSMHCTLVAPNRPQRAGEVSICTCIYVV